MIFLHYRKPHGCCDGYAFNATLDTCVGKYYDILYAMFVCTQNSVQKKVYLTSEPFCYALIYSKFTTLMNTIFVRYEFLKNHFNTN